MATEKRIVYVAHEANRYASEHSYVVYLHPSLDLLNKHGGRFSWGDWDEETISWQRARADAIVYARWLAAKHNCEVQLCRRQGRY